MRRIAIDEISYQRGHRYLTLVVDHDSGRLVWAAACRDERTLRRFFDLLGEQRSAQITHVSAHAADWIARVVAQRCPQAVRCADPFHVVKWATEALDVVRHQAWNDARAGRPQVQRGRRLAYPRVASPLRRTRYALWRNPEHLTDHQRAQLAWVAKTDPLPRTPNAVDQCGGHRRRLDGRSHPEGAAVVASAYATATAGVVRGAGYELLPTHRVPHYDIVLPSATLAAASTLLELFGVGMRNPFRRPTR